MGQLNKLVRKVSASALLNPGATNALRECGKNMANAASDFFPHAASVALVAVANTANFEPPSVMGDNNTDMLKYLG